MIAWLGDKVLDGFAAMERSLAAWQARRRWQRLQTLGMRIGRDVVLPPSTWIDTAHCYLIDIGDGCAFGPQCLILAHDAQMDEFLDAGRLGRVVIGAGCQVGARSVILCNVEIGAGCVIEAGSVVATSLPAASYCAGSPAKVVCSVAEWTRRLERDAAGRPTLTPQELRARAATADGRQALWADLAGGAALVRPPGRDAAPLDRPLLP